MSMLLCPATEFRLRRKTDEVVGMLEYLCESCFGVFTSAFSLVFQFAIPK